MPGIMSIETPSDFEKKRTLQRTRMAIKEVKITACNNDNCMDEPSGLLNLRLSHAIFQHLPLVTCHDLTRQPKLESFETQALYQYNIKPEKHTQMIMRTEDHGRSCHLTCKRAQVSFQVIVVRQAG